MSTTTKENSTLPAIPPKENIQFNHERSITKSWDTLPCEGIYKLTSEKESINFSYCNADYWNCPNKTCVMNLV